jgi:protein gp37
VNTDLQKKISNRMHLGTSNWLWPRHIWLGVSVENQRYTWRVDALRRSAAPIRFISAEPLLGPLVLNLEGISWLIVGAESGHGARSMEVEWARSLKNQAVETDTRFFLKQFAVHGRKVHLPELDGRIWNEFPG